MKLWQIKDTPHVFESIYGAKACKSLIHSEAEIICFEAPDPDFCRFDYNKSYIYVRNSKLTVYGNGDIEWTAEKLPKSYKYAIRTRRLSKLPEGKKVNQWYFRN